MKYTVFEPKSYSKWNIWVEAAWHAKYLRKSHLSEVQVFFFLKNYVNSTAVFSSLALGRPCGVIPYCTVVSNLVVKIYNLHRTVTFPLLSGFFLYTIKIMNAGTSTMKRAYADSTRVEWRPTIADYRINFEMTSVWSVFRGGIYFRDIPGVFTYGTPCISEFLFL